MKKFAAIAGLIIYLVLIGICLAVNVVASDMKTQDTEQAAATKK